jgi:ubiquinone/menaquinone biosynthesis C-methylase UbiE
MKLWWRLVRFGFRLLYNEFAFTYDLVSKVVSLGAWRCWQRSAIKHLNAPEGSRILELAHGTGDLQTDLYAAGYQIVGYDLSPHMGRIASRKLRRQSIPVRLAQGQAQALPFADASFPMVVCTFPSEFIAHEETLREAYRVLQSNGRFVVVITGVFTTRGLVIRLLEWLYRITGQRDVDAAQRFTEEQQTYLAERYERFLTIFHDAGFTTELVTETCPRSLAQVIVAEKTISFT